jgi:Sec-independent protein translocase protein TatA
MKQSPAIKNDWIKDSLLSQVLFFMCLTAGLLFGANPKFVSATVDGGQFLEATKISTHDVRLVDPNSIEQATVENEEKEEKEEKENESEKDSKDIFFDGHQKSHLINGVLGYQSNINTPFEALPKGKLYLLFHCLKSDLA